MNEPETLTDNPIISFDVHKKFSLNCSIAIGTGNKVKITWFKNDYEINEAAYFPDGNKRQLSIFNTTDLDEGFYKCAVVKISSGNGGSKIILYKRFNLTFRPYWSKWSQWSQCQPKCGNSRIKRRFRICHQPKIRQPITQLRCVGANVQRRRCSIALCEEGVWTQWSHWSNCSRTCGIGQMFRHRECTSDHCIGPNIEVIECFRIHCTGNVQKFPEKSRFVPYTIYSRGLV